MSGAPANRTGGGTARPADRTGGGTAQPASPAARQLAAPDALHLAPLRWWDLQEVLALEAELFGDEAWTPGQFWSELARVPETRWYAVARRPDDPRIIGYAGVFIAGAEADVQTVAVAPAAQGRGVGRHLVRALADEAVRRGAALLHLEVRADNAAALALYEALGFLVDGRRRDYYGRGRDAVLMTARLEVGHDGQVGHG
ncbi:MAG TPA: ribosomal protein S18-alanine N-acetyltransferase [Candidatus Nanopelagicales bacterium]